MKRTMWAVLGMAATLAGCSDSTGLSSNGPGQVSLSITTSVAGGPTASNAMFMLAGADTLSDGQNELVITQAELVLREIELERISDDACDSLAVDDDGCEKFETGPVLLDLPLDGSVEQVLVIQPDTGTYDELEFDLHKVSDDDPDDAAFRAAYPDMVGKSIRIQGSYNGQPFTYENDINDEQEYDLVPPLVVDEMTTDVNVTIRIDIDSWFRTASGDLVNPQSANKGGANESLVNDNIKNSFEAFEDDDHDGEDDDEDDS
jgi:hypothetical protein